MSAGVGLHDALDILNAPTRPASAFFDALAQADQHLADDEQRACDTHAYCGDDL